MTKELIITMLEMGKAQLVNTFNSVPDDKLNWKPLDNGRTVLDLFSEAAQSAGLLKVIQNVASNPGEGPTMRDMFQAMREQRATWSRTDALDWLQTTHGELIGTIQGLTDEQLAQTVTLPMGGGMTMPMGAWAMMVYRTYVSRFAQINYIQTLYGDFDHH